MTQGYYTVLENTPLTDTVWRMILKGDTTALTAPGQFVNLKIDGLYLRRPISVCDFGPDSLTLLYKTVGEGTRRMTAYAPGEKIDLLCGLGNGFDLSLSGDRPLLIGGGVGIPPLYRLAKELLEQGRTVQVILGFNTAQEIFYEDEFRALGAQVTIATADGSRGVYGFVTDAMAGLSYTYFYTCGPLPMYHAIERVVSGSGQYSFEERMGCGFGACMGCTCKTKYGNKRICKDGPVLKREEIVW